MSAQSLIQRLEFEYCRNPNAQTFLCIFHEQCIGQQSVRLANQTNPVALLYMLAIISLFPHIAKSLDNLSGNASDIPFSEHSGTFVHHPFTHGVVMLVKLGSGTVQPTTVIQHLCLQFALQLNRR